MANQPGMTLTVYEPNGKERTQEKEVEPIKEEKKEDVQETEEKVV